MTGPIFVCFEFSPNLLIFRVAEAILTDGRKQNVNASGSKFQQIFKAVN